MNAEMVIVSQNKKTTLKLKDVREFGIVGNELVAFTHTPFYYLMGTYDSYERAMDALSTIQYAASDPVRDTYVCY